MTYEEFLKEREAYEYIACPTGEDFGKYSDAFFQWVNAALQRSEAKCPFTQKKSSKHGCNTPDPQV